MKKILNLQNVFGKRGNYSLPYSNPKTNAKSVHEALDELYNSGISGTTIVDTLPAQSDAGQIYYNTTDKTFYVSNGEGYNAMATAGKIITDVNDIVSLDTGINVGTDENPAVGSVRKFRLNPNDFYNLDGVVDTTGEQVVKPHNTWFQHEYGQESPANYLANTLAIDLIGAQTNNAYVWAGRFRAPEDNTIISISSSVYIDDADNLSIKAGSLYEFNIIAGVCMIKEIV